MRLIERAREQYATMSQRFHEGAPGIVQLVRRSLLMQLLSVYLIFVLIVLATGLEAANVGERQLVNEIQTTDVALAQQIAFDTEARVTSVENSLVALSQLPPIRDGVIDDMDESFNAFRVSQRDVDQVFWLDATGAMRASAPESIRTLGVNVLSQPVFQRAAQAHSVIVQAGMIDLTTYNADIYFATPVRDTTGHLLGVLGAGVLLDGLNGPIHSVMNAQAAQHATLRISIVDQSGNLIASPDRERLLQSGLADLPGALAALQGQTTTQSAQAADGTTWLFSATPIRTVDWAVVVQRPEADITSAVSNFRNWLGLATALFALGGLLFWLILVWRVVRPLHALTTANRALTDRSGVQDESALTTARGATHGDLTPRADEIGSLARTLARLNHDVALQLNELHALLDTSNAVVHSLDPQAVGKDIIREVRRLVDVQAAAVLAPDDKGGLRTLVSEGCEPVSFAAGSSRLLNGAGQPALRALRDGEPMQMIADGNPAFPSRSYAQGFRSVLALPITTERVGSVVLEVQRTQPAPFTETEVNLLMTFANYATLAWEHAVLYERTDERLREVAEENAQLYQQANAERQTLSAIMSSMSDGLLLASADGSLLYANPGVRALINLSDDMAPEMDIEKVHGALAAAAEKPDRYQRDRAKAEAGGSPQWVLETRRENGGRSYTVRIFEVHDEANATLGQGLLLRDITPEREADLFKNTLLAAVGHELRTPLAAIKGHASTLLQDDVTWPLDDQRHFLHTISSEADRLAQMVSNLLDLSRLEAGLLLLRRAPAPIDELLRESTRRISSERPVAIDVAADLPNVDVDAARIEVVIRNLVNNALAYGDGDVRVRARRDGAFVAVTVADNGPGIGDDDLPYIFERFYRASHGQRRTSSGAGLGLAICKAFVEAHGGRIWADNKGDDGAVISFTLPIAITERAATDDEQKGKLSAQLAAPN